MNSLTLRVGAAVFLLTLSQPAFSQERGQERPQDKNDHYILTGPDAEDLRDVAQGAGGRIVSRLHYHSGWVIEMSASQALALKTTLALRKANRASEGSSPSNEDEIFEKDGSVGLIDAAVPAVVVDDASLKDHQKLPWGVTAVHAPDVFSKARGKSVTVCVIDTGVDREHPDLEGAVKGGENTITLYPDHAQRSWDDDNGHGTHVSGTIAARDNDMGVVGVAPEARIFAVKALNSRGSGNFSSLAEGLRSCMAHGAQVVNMSIGYEDDSQVVRKAVQDALDAGLILVAAAGNEKGSVDYPAKIPGVLAVSALSTDHRLAYFSNRGPEVAFIAPGENVLSTYPGNRYAFMDGTSQATPHVAGVVALLLSAGVHHVSSHLKGDDMGLSQEAQGAGCIDAQKSLKGLFEQLTLN